MNFHEQVVFFDHECYLIICEYHFQVHLDHDQDLLNKKKIDSIIYIYDFNLQADEFDVSSPIEPLGVLIHRTFVGLFII